MADATFEDFFNSGGGGSGVDIGDVTQQPPTGPSYEKGSQLYLRTGFFVDKTGFPAAAADERCKVTGLDVTLPLAVSARESAHDGAGTVIVVYNANTILRSTDWGATWATVTVGGGVTFTAAVRAGTRFIIAGNTGTSINVYYSNDGSAWTGGGSVASSGMVADTVTGAWNGTVAMFVTRNSTNGALTTPDGAALTQRIIPAGLQTSFIVAKGTTFLFGAASDGTIYTTTTGAPGSFTTIPVSALDATDAPHDAAIVGGTALVFFGSAGRYVTSADLASWQGRRVPLASNITQRTTNNRPLTSDGVRAYWSGRDRVMWTDNGADWYVRTTSTALPPGYSWHVVAGRAAVPTGSQSADALATADWTVADYVGRAVAADTNTELVGYMRIR